MANQSNIHRYGHRSYYPSIASISSTDSGHMYPPPREMGPPMDFPPQPVEIDLNMSRTLPSLQASTAAPEWNQAHGFGDMPPYGSLARIPEIPNDGQNRGTQQNPLYQWYSDNDGPWNPVAKVIPDITGDRFPSKQTGRVTYGQYRQPNHLDQGSFQFGVPPSDSGYETRRSDGSTSVFSGDVTERDHDRQHRIGIIPDFQPIPLNEFRERTSESWNTPVVEHTVLVCQTCKKSVKTQSELKKHDLRHRKPFTCKIPDCSRREGFSTTNDLDRHMRSKHPGSIGENTRVKKFRCLVQGCKSKEKSWPRLDNFKSHLVRLHKSHFNQDLDLDVMIKRGEFWERPGLVIDQELPMSTLPDPRTTSPGDDMSRRPLPDWKPLYPEVISSQDLISKRPQLETFEPRAPLSDERSSIADRPQHQLPAEPQRVTIQPSEVFVREPEPVIGSRVSPDTLLTPAGQNSPEPQPQPRKTLPGKPKQSDILAAAATLTKAIKTVFAGETSPKDTSDSGHNSPDGRHSPQGSSPSEGGSPIHGNDCQENSATELSKDLLAQKKAEEVLKIIKQLGYTVSKDPTHTPKAQNAGSAASNKSEKQTICGTCKRFKGRPCELRKHMKRHERPYGCTFLTCSKTFGSKNDWKRHENSQHFHLETWRCSTPRPEGGSCAKVCYRKQTFSDHLRKDHSMTDPQLIETKLQNCRIGRNCQARFWCGFCVRLVDLKKKGLDAWTERFDHIDDHFMGRGDYRKQSIQDWIPVDSDKPKGDLEDNVHVLGEKESSSEETSPAASEDTEDRAELATVAKTALERAPKRGRPEELIVEERPAKQVKRYELAVFCCQCKLQHNPKLVARCTNCENSHQFCRECEEISVPMRMDV